MVMIFVNGVKWASLVAWMVKNLPVMWERTVHWRREWPPTPVFLLGQLHGQRILVSYSPWGRKNLDTTEGLALSVFMVWRKVSGVLQLTHTSSGNLIGNLSGVWESRCQDVKLTLLWWFLFFSHSVMSVFAMQWTAARQASLSFTISQTLLKLMSIELVRPSNCLILCHPPLFPPSIFPRIRVFSEESALCIRWPKYWSFSFSISPSNEHLGLISFRMDWLDLLAVQATLKSLLQHHSSKASILWRSSYFMAQLWHPSMTTGENH